MRLQVTIRQGMGGVKSLTSPFGNRMMHFLFIPNTVKP